MKMNNTEHRRAIITIWDDSEIEDLKKYYKDYEYKDLVRFLPNKTVGQIKNKILNLKLKKKGLIKVQIGDVFEKLTVIENQFYGIENGRKTKMVKVRCSCENKTEKYVNVYKMVSGHTKSCGCFKIKRNFTHGLSKHKLYKSFRLMVSRCEDKNAHDYKYYGGKGIKICPEWRNDFRVFVKWALDNGWRPGLTIDRIDNNKDYCPENCRIATVLQQNNNKTTNFFIEAFGERKTASEWARDKRCMVSASGLIGRSKRKWESNEVMITTPNICEEIIFSAFGEAKTLAEWAKDRRCHISLEALKGRILYANKLKLSKTNEEIISVPYQDKKSKIIEAFGERKTLREWAKDDRCVVDAEGLRLRTKRKWRNNEEMISKPDHRCRKIMVEAFGEIKPLIEWAKDEKCKVDLNTLRKRLRRKRNPYQSNEEMILFAT